MSGSIRRDGNTAGKRKYHSFTSEETTHVGSKDYVCCLANPFDYDKSPRIPDLAAYPTCVSTLQLEITQLSSVQVGGGYCTGGAVVLHNGGVSYVPEIAMYAGSLNTAHASSDGTIQLFSPGGAAAASANVYVPASTTYAGIATTDHGGAFTTNYFIPGVDSLMANSAASRIVAAGIRVEFIGNDQNNQGLITGANITALDIQDFYQVNIENGVTPSASGFYDVNYAATTGQITTSPKLNWCTPCQSQSALENFRNNYSGAAKDGIVLTYQPLDDVDLFMGPGTNRTASGAAGYLQYSEQTNTTRQPMSQAGGSALLQQGVGVTNQGLLQWHAQNIASTAMFRVYVVLHMEYIPKTDNISLPKPMVQIGDENGLKINGIIGSIRPGSAKEDKPKKTEQIVAKTYDQMMNSHSPYESMCMLRDGFAFADAINTGDYNSALGVLKKSKFTQGYF